MADKENWLAALGQNAQFVAFFAHLGAAEILTVLAFRFTRFGPEVVALIILGAAIKEFYFDAKYEKNPPQTFKDNLQDFVGWALGPVVGWLLR